MIEHEFYQQQVFSVFGKLFAPVQGFYVRTRKRFDPDTTYDNVLCQLLLYRHIVPRFKSTYNKSLTNSGFYWIICRSFLNGRVN